MAVVKTTLAAMVATLFGKSEKAISEKLSTEEFNEFTTDAQAAASRITELETEKETAGTTISGLTTRAETAEASLATAETTISGLTTRAEAAEGALVTAETERDQYKGWFDEKKATGKALPTEDASNKGAEPEGLSDYNAGALAVFRKAKGGATT